MKRGLEAGILQTIKNLMDTLKMTAKQAMAALKIPENGQLKYVTILKENG